MTLSTEATKYRDDFAKTAQHLAQEVSAKEYRSDLELIKEINRSIESLKKIRDKHVQQ